jgi:copper chaperone CopZ
MNRIKKIAPMVVLALLIAGIAWACKTSNTSAAKQADATKCPYESAQQQAKAGACPYATEASHAKLTGAGSHCDGVGKSAEAMAHECGMKAGQVMYSFAVPGAECEHCIRGIQKATLAMKGVECAHVDLSTHTAYIIAAKGVTEKAISKSIQDAGFKNSYKGSGSKVQAAFIEAMKGGTKNGMSCCPAGKEKDKV